jgi:hypothetical protein
MLARALQSPTRTRNKMPSGLTMKPTQSGEPGAPRMAARSPRPTRRSADFVDTHLGALGFPKHLRSSSKPAK